MLSALNLARAIENGELTPTQVIDRCAEAIARREDEVGAFIALDVAGARKAAEAPGLKDTPLRGLPVGLKDIFDTADLPTECGSPIFRGRRPARDAAAVAGLRRAGVEHAQALEDQDVGLADDGVLPRNHVVGDVGIDWRPDRGLSRLEVGKETTRKFS